MTLTSSGTAPARSTVVILCAALAVCALLVLVAHVLWPALTTVPYWDDMYSLIAIDAAASRGRPSFAVTGDLIGFWRPIELLLNAILRPLDPVGFLPVKLVALALHAAKAFAVALIVRRLAPKLPVIIALFSGIVALAHPIAVSAIVQIDTVSEAVAAAAIAWALLLMLEAVSLPQAGRRRHFVSVAILCAVALLGKEASLPAVVAMPVVGFAAARDRRAILPLMVRLAIGLATICVVFLGVRYGLGFWRPQTGDDRYQIGLGFNVLRNIATVAGSLSYFGNTVALISDRDPAALVGFVPVLAAMGLVVHALVWRRRALMALLDSRALVACAIMALAAVSATSLAPMISEHNAAMVSAAYLSAVLAITGAAATVAGPWSMRVALLAALLASGQGLLAMRDKAVAAAMVGKAVADVRHQIAGLARTKDAITVCITPDEGRAYSIYRLPAERWMGEETVWEEHILPGKAVTVAVRKAGPDCDVVTPNFAGARPAR